jgi:hypothetical protein
MEGVKERIASSRELLGQIQKRRQEVQVEAEKARENVTVDPETTFWDRPQESRAGRSSPDDLDLEFKQWEMEEELNQLKRDLGE